MKPAPVEAPGTKPPAGNVTLYDAALSICVQHVCTMFHEEIAMPIAKPWANEAKVTVSEPELVNTKS